MNISLDRARTFVEEQGHMRSDAEHSSSDMLDRIEGHDLVGIRLLEHWNHYQTARANFAPPSEEYQKSLLAMEQTFWERFLLPTLNKNTNIVPLGVSIDTDMTTTLSHEILHAQYFLSETMRRAVEDFWRNDVTNEHRSRIRNELSRHYDANDETLMMNEFQAYVLMVGAQSYRAMLRSMVPIYREKLIQKLRAVGIEPIQFDINNLPVRVVPPAISSPIPITPPISAKSALSAETRGLAAIVEKRRR